MSIVAKVATAIIGIAAVAAVWIASGQDAGRTVDYIVSNWSTVVLGVQIAVMFILAATKHYIGGSVLLVTSLATLFGVVL